MKEYSDSLIILEAARIAVAALKVSEITAATLLNAQKREAAMLLQRQQRAALELLLP